MQILPFLESMMLDYEFSERWDDPINKFILDMHYRCFCLTDPADPSSRCRTNVVAITGPGTAFESEKTISLSDLDADTILAIEVADSGVHWLEPGDISIENLPPRLMQGLDGGGVFVLFADTEPWYISSDVPISELKKFFTIEGAKQFDREKILGPHAWRGED